MTGVRITVNDRELSQVLRRLARIGAEPGRFLRPIGLQLINSTRERARREVSPDFTPWPELTPAYAAKKRGGHMMRESGNLLGSLTREVEGNTLRVGTNRIYAAIHQFGGRAGRGRKVTMPTRPWLGLSRDDITMIREEFEAFALRATRRG
jgi:phage virion morphogenesis protein